MHITQTVKDACVVFAIAALCAVPLGAHAQYPTERIPDESVVGDFVVGPGKVEVFLDPGESQTTEVLVTNRTGEERIFKLEVEDFIGSQSTEETVVLLGDARGPYSLKDYVSFEAAEFPLEHAERARIPVTITVPPDAEPGGLYGSLLVSVTSQPTDEDADGGARGGAALVTRVGVLFFVRIPGAVLEEGQMREFDLAGGKRILTELPVEFDILFENTGSVHLNPYGIITVTNATGEIIGEREVEPWFVLPDALRLREITWHHAPLIGRYTATAQINRGYDDIVDEASVSFWVLPIKIIVPVIVGLIILLILVRFIFTRFEFRRKGHDTTTTNQHNKQTM